MKARHAATFMRAFGDPSRLRIIAALTRAPLSVAELTQLLQCPPQRTSRHLRYLHARAVVESHTEGNSVVYCLVEPGSQLQRLVLAAVRGGLGDIDEVRDDADRLAQAQSRRRAGSPRTK